MMDCARNGVMRVEQMKKLMDYLKSWDIITLAHIYADGEFDIDKIKEAFNADMGIAFENFSALATVNWHVDKPAGQTADVK